MLALGISGLPRLYVKKPSADACVVVSDRSEAALLGSGHGKLFWFGSIEANTIVAYGTLSKK